MKIEDIAAVCHGANKAFCESQGDFSQAAWNQAPAWQRGSVVAGVQHAIDNPETTTEDSHESWMAMKEAEGWKYGEKKDALHKTHPCYLPYDELPELQKVKDHVFLAICGELIPLLSVGEPTEDLGDVQHADVDAVDAKVEMNDADVEAMDMDAESRKTLPSGAPMPIIKPDGETSDGSSGD